jgi:hypothetical protein
LRPSSPAERTFGNNNLTMKSYSKFEHENAPDLTSRGRSRYLEHETGLAGACRFAAGALR